MRGKGRGRRGYDRCDGNGREGKGRGSVFTRFRLSALNLHNITALSLLFLYLFHMTLSVCVYVCVGVFLITHTEVLLKHL